ncbi:MAG: hypothetical protein GX369_08330 [Euryarchaeota archaeon]|nr:hypothetical protein [Euryarchaeota archaeon]
MFSSRFPTPSEQEAQYNALVQQLAKIGLRPENVPQAMEELKKQIYADLVKAKQRLAKPAS